MSTPLTFDKFKVNGNDVAGNPIDLTMNTDASVVAVYKAGAPMGTATFNGTVNGQAAAGRQVVITITKPGGSTEVVGAITLADKSFTATYVNNVAGAYSAVAKALSDAQYAEASSPAVPFTFNLLSTTVTLTVTVS